MSTPSQRATSSGVIRDLRFLRRSAPANVRPQLEGLLLHSTTSLRIAVCFFTEPGRVFLSRHTLRLTQTDSYFIASVDLPTNLDSLRKLHDAAPGHVYIHLGGTTPKEESVGRSLMHSKVFLAEGDADCKLWVGSHNLTGMAIEGGNFEAGLLVTAPASSEVVQDALAHLEACRATAELFNPADMERYQDIQRRRSGQSDWDIEKGALVIHAEAAQMPAESPFIIHMHVYPTECDSWFRMERAVRLFLHPPGSLKPRTPVEFERATLWTGEITAVVRTELHPKTRGATGSFATANYDIDIRDLKSLPVFMAGGLPTVRARTQVVMRLDGQGELGVELFSTGDRSPVENVLDSSQALELHEVDSDVAQFFTEDSLVNRTFLFRPVTGIRQNIVITGYEETQRSRLPNRPSDETIEVVTERVHYSTKTPRRPIDPFFYLGTHTIRPRREPPPFDEDSEPTTSSPGRDGVSAQRTLFDEIVEGQASDAGLGDLAETPPDDAVLARVQQAMRLFAADRMADLKRFLVEGDVGTDARFWKVAHALAAHYPSGSDEKRWVDGVLASKKDLDT